MARAERKHSAERDHSAERRHGAEPDDRAYAPTRLSGGGREVPGSNRHETGCETRRWSRAGAAAKRLLDIGGSLFGLVVLSPLFAAVAMAIRLDSPGPVFFRQQRLGLNGRPFVIYKFRTMFAEADSEVHREYVQALIAGGGSDLKGESGAYKLDGDTRITRVGSWLRTTSIDELPQLLNVLRGEMSLVGPRPPLGYEVELYSERDARRLEVTPGMTGLWQVSGRNNTDFAQMVELDLAYIERRSLLLDLRILARTFTAVLSRSGY